MLGAVFNIKDEAVIPFTSQATQSFAQSSAQKPTGFLLAC